MVSSSHSEARYSFEVFPPAREGKGADFITLCETLFSYDPAFVSVTYGAGGSGRDRSVKAVSSLAGRALGPITAHLTCVAQTRDEIGAVADGFWAEGVRSILALGGDLPEGGVAVPETERYRYASEMVAGLRARHDFDISVAAFPEGRPGGESWEDDVTTLAGKVSAGATRAITQYFFDDGAFLRYRDRVRARGIEVTVVPGIMPIANYKGIRAFSERCGAYLPQWLHDRFEPLADDPDGQREAALDIATRQVDRLRGEGVDFFHFYTLNRTDLVFATLDAVGLRGKCTAAA